MFEVVKKNARPDTNVEFFDTKKHVPNVSAEITNYFSEKYIKTGKRISATKTLSDDNLIEYTTEIWDSKDSYLEYLCDSFFDDHIKPFAKEHITKYDIKLEIISAKEL